uniref:Uncharacterized protein n=1 Tax=Cacopsylla melanoneura TaxID=428564 RepID=A0A8D8QAK0_9HEMI
MRHQTHPLHNAPHTARLMFYTVESINLVSCHVYHSFIVPAQRCLILESWNLCRSRNLSCHAYNIFFFLLYLKCYTYACTVICTLTTSILCQVPTFIIIG